MAQHLDADQRLRELDLHERIVEAALRGGVGDGAVQPRAQLDLARERGRPAFVAERVHGDLPAVAAVAQQVLLGDDHVVEEELTELGVAGDLRHRAHVDAVGLHVDDQHRDALVLGAVRLRARENAAPARVLAPRDPGLGAVQHEVVVLLGRARAQRREVRAGLGLAEALAPDLLGGEDRGDVPPALLIVAEAQQRRAEHAEPDHVDELRSPGRGEFLVDEDLLDGRSSAAAELAGPGAADVAGRVAGGLPLAQQGHPVVKGVGEIRAHQRGLGQEAANLVLERPLLIRSSKLHELRSYQSMPTKWLTLATFGDVH